MVLENQFDSDPKNIVKNKTVKDAFESIKTRFKGFGYKTTALLLKEYSQNGTYNPGNSLFSLPIPVDIHIMRFVVRTFCKDSKLVEKLNDADHQKFSRMLQKYLQEFTSNYKLDPIEVDSSVWIYSREKCSKENCRQCRIDCDPGIKVEYKRYRNGKRKGRRTGEVTIKRFEADLLEFGVEDE